MLQRPPTRPQAPGGPAVLDCERLDVYAAAMAFQRLAGRLTTRLTGAFRDQFDRASLSILLNLAEGVGRTQPADKAHYYAISRGSATECAALLDAARGRGLLDPSLCVEARALLLRIVQMTTRLEQAMARRKQHLSAEGRTAG